jgi:hypothetical protein
VINGAEVLVEGTVNGDINASKKLVLGATAVLTGNIKTPSLQIRDGAFFRGQVTMQQPEEVAAKAKTEARVEAKQRTAPAPGSASGSSGPGKGDGKASKETGSAAKPAAKPVEGAAKSAGATGA